MLDKKWLLMVINIIGGIAVLGSYAHGFLTHPGGVDVLWGSVPANIRALYTTNMLLAASGYFAFTLFIFFYLPASGARIGGSFGFGTFNIIYAGILIPSALWMPLTYLTMEQSSLGLLWLVRLILAVVGIASIGLLLALWKVEPRKPQWSYRMALIGAIFFCIQTVLLDAIIWASSFQL
jgi:hypothetical protein